MIINKKSLASAAFAGTLLFNAFASNAFAATLEISGNGTGSTSTATSNSTANTTTVQNNDAHISNNVDTNSNTGGNDANANTGGSVAINTGGAASGVSINNAANLNQASLPCNCLGNVGDSHVLIAGNGAHSDNFGSVNSNSNNQLFQTNNAWFDNNVHTTANTGDNNANANTGRVGGGDSFSINTGGTLSTVGIQNKANANVATGSVGAGSGVGSSMTEALIGNGAGSLNTAVLSSNNSNLVDQTNSAWISNHVTNRSNTGDNDANANTGGSVAVRTGSANAGTALDNMANFNSADLSCGCFLGGGVQSLISGNGAHSDNFLSSNLDTERSMFQTNRDDLNNRILGGATTGNNDSNANTGSVFGGSSFSQMTGSTTTLTSVSNRSNANIVGPSATFQLPGGTNFGVNFDFGDLLRFFHMI